MYKLNTYSPPYVILSSDFSQQEPKLVAFVSQDSNMVKAFQEGKDIYATIASIAFHTTYEACLEFNPDNGEYQPEGKARRSEAKTIVLGICYGRSVPSIGQQLYHSRDDMSDEEKTKEAQKVYDAVMKAFPALKNLMLHSQAFAHKHGYVETILGRRRHLPDMLLDEFEFKPMAGYVNPDVDPMDLSTLDGESGIPEHKIAELKAEFSKFKWFGQIAKRTKQLYEDESIKVVNNRPKMNDAKRQCVNCVDDKTEILTLEGWKSCDDIKIGDSILAYSQELNELVKDKIQQIHIQEQQGDEPLEVYHIYNAAFDSVCTKNHRWVMRNFDTNQVSIYDTEHILKVHRPRYHILRIASNSINKDKSNLSVEYIVKSIRDGTIIPFEIFQLTCEQALEAYIHFRDNIAYKGNVEFDNEYKADMFQLLAIMCGRVCNKRKYTTNRKKKPNVTTWKVTCCSKPMYQTARIDLMKKEPQTTNKVWCVTTNTGTWIARRDGKYYITGNSIIQGSAADFTKMALLKVMQDPRWKAVGGKVLTVVHDEIIAEVPVDKWEEGAQILKSNMEQAGAFLPFPINCDVTVSYRWYGLELPCKFNKPKSMCGELSENDLGWIQWHLVDLGYELPVFNDEDGNKPIGDAAHGVSCKPSQEMNTAIENYCNRYNVRHEDFLDDIEQRVKNGLVVEKE